MCIKVQAPGAAVYAFEPIPKTFQVLDLNIRSLECSDIYPYNVAIGSQGRTEKTFTFFPNMPGNSTTVPAIKDDVRPAMDQVFGKKLSDILYQSESCIAQVRTLSSIIRERGISSVDYLKVDVEGGELSVLEGVEEQHWPIFRQVAVEAHTAPLHEQVCDYLGHRGFEIYSDLGISSPVGVSMLYARRL